MPYEHKPGTGTVFPNDRKQQDSHADYRGDGMDFDGNPIWLDIWQNTTKDGKTYWKVQFKRKGAAAPPPPPIERDRADLSDEAQGLADELDDEIPF